MMLCLPEIFLKLFTSNILVHYMGYCTSFTEDICNPIKDYIFFPPDSVICFMGKRKKLQIFPGFLFPLSVNLANCGLQDHTLL